jgi:hypothetical protein
MQQAVVVLTALCAFLWLPCVCPRLYRGRALTTSQTEADGSALCQFYEALSSKGDFKAGVQAHPLTTLAPRLHGVA